MNTIEEFFKNRISFIQGSGRNDDDYGVKDWFSFESEIYPEFKH